jgi:uncharacterized protein YaiE (UPF0345 family)
MSTFENASVSKKANVYFDGKCVSHTVMLADGSRKSVGVIFPSSLRFTTGVAETMEVIGGTCAVTLDGAATSSAYGAGQSFDIPANSAFEIETFEMLEYVCHFR